MVVLAAARVGGIVANNTYPAEFLSENLRIQVNVMDAAHAAGVQRLLFLGSSCIYPKFAEQPIRESSLLTGALEPTNDAYAIAKIAGVLSAGPPAAYGERWIYAMPTTSTAGTTSSGRTRRCSRPHRGSMGGESGGQVVLWGLGPRA